jgi:hypothetical protein
MEPFADGSLHTSDRLRPEAYILHMALRKIVLPRGSNRESLTSLQQVATTINIERWAVWLLTFFPVWDWGCDSWCYQYWMAARVPSHHQLSATHNWLWSECVVVQRVDLQGYDLHASMSGRLSLWIVCPLVSCYPYRTEKDMKWWMQP